MMRLVAVAVDDRDVTGASSASTAILFDVEVPLVTKKTRSAPKARAALSCAFLMLPVGSSRCPGRQLSRSLGQEQVQAVEFAHVANRVQLEDDLPRAIGNAWKVPIGRCAYFLRLSKNGVSKRSCTPSRIDRCSSRTLRSSRRSGEQSARGSGHLLHVVVGYHIEIEFGRTRLRICASRSAETELVLRPADEAMCGVPARHDATECKAFVDHDGRKVGIQDRRTECVFKGSDDAGS